MRVAVLGAGLTGSLVALELADSGCNVDLFDREHAPITQASANNEGKIHLGFVYANDRSGRTARTMIEGALTFAPLLERWIEGARLRQAVSDPFRYAVPRSSMLGLDEIEDHFRRTEAMLRERTAGGGGRYIADLDGPLFRRAPPGDHADLFDPAEVAASYATGERSIDPQMIAAVLRPVIEVAPRIALRLATEVLGAADADARGIEVRYCADGAAGSAVYDRVVNALWQDRVAIDGTFGLSSPRQVMHRYKVGLFARKGQAVPDLPTVTFLLGEFGDTASFRDHAYVSWYPAGLLRQERRLRPSRPAPQLAPDEARSIVDRSLAALRGLMPGAAAALTADGAQSRWELAGGYVTAWGETGIDDPASTLHRRDLVGVASRGAYHSVDTGKYTLAPMLAHEACARVLGSERAGAPT